MAIKRVNTLQIKFNRSQQRPQPAEIHEFVMETLKFTIDQLYGIQLNSNDNTVYVKLVSSVLFERALKQYGGAVQCNLFNGDIVEAIISDAGLEETYIRLFNLPFETTEEDIKKCLAPYGKIRAIAPEHWSKHYRVTGIYNGLRAVTMELTKPVPSFIRYEGYRVQVIYEGQPQTCHVCNQMGHLRSECPERKNTNSDISHTREMRKSTEVPMERRLFTTVVKPTISLKDDLRGKAIVPVQTAEEKKERYESSEVKNGNSRMMTNEQDMIENSQGPEQLTPQMQVATEGEPDKTSLVWAEDIGNQEMEMDVATKDTLTHGSELEIGELPAQKKSKWDTLKESEERQIEDKREPTSDGSKIKSQVAEKEGDAMRTVGRTSMEPQQASTVAATKIKTARPTKEQEQLNRHPYTSLKDPRLQNKK